MITLDIWDVLAIGGVGWLLWQIGGPIIAFVL